MWGKHRTHSMFPVSSAGMAANEAYDWAFWNLDDGSVDLHCGDMKIIVIEEDYDN